MCKRLFALLLVLVMLVSMVPGTAVAIDEDPEKKPAATDSLETEPKETESKETEPKKTEPKETESKETEPKETEPKETEPKETEPKETEPKETEPKETEPKETEPKETEPKETEPKETESKETEPKETEPKETEPEETEPEETEPKETEPEETEPDSTEPDSTEPDSTEPDSTEPDSTEPDSTEPEKNPNTRDVKTGTLRIRTEFDEESALDGDDFPDGYPVTIWDINSNKVATVLLTAENGWEETLELPVGRYHYKEFPRDVQGYRNYGVGSWNAIISTYGDVDEGKRTTLCFTNCFADPNVNRMTFTCKTYEGIEDDFPNGLEIYLPGVARFVLSEQNGWTYKTTEIPRGWRLMYMSGDERMGHHLVPHILYVRYLTPFSWLSSTGDESPYDLEANPDCLETVVTITCNFEPDFIVSKTFGSSSHLGAEDFPDGVTVVVSSESGTELKRFVLSAANNWSYAVTDLPAGKYIVSEIAPELSPEAEDYHLSSKCTVSGWSAKSAGEHAWYVDYTSDRSYRVARVTIENSYVGPGQLKVTKKFDSRSMLTAEDFPEGVTVVVNDQNGNEVARAVLSAANNWEHTFTLLPGTYTIVEPAAEVEGYTNFATCSVEVDGEIPTVSETPSWRNWRPKVPAGGRAIATITNCYAKPKSIILRGDIWGSLSKANFPEGMTAVISDSSGAEVKRVVLSDENGWFYVVTDLPAGEYMVDTLGGQRDGYIFNKSISVGRVPDSYNLEEAVQDPRLFTISEHTANFASLVHDYTESFTITKTFGEFSKLGADDFPDGITVVISNQSGTELKRVVLSAENGWHQVVPGLPAGKYIVREIVPEQEEYLHISEGYVFRDASSADNGWGQVDEAVPIGKMSPAESAGENAWYVDISEDVSLNVNITNFYYELGSLTVTKEFGPGSALTAEDFPHGIMVEVEVVINTGMSEAHRTYRQLLSSQNNWTHTFDIQIDPDLKEGGVIATVREVDAAREGYHLRTTGIGEFIIKPQETAATTITNTYLDGTMGVLTVRKVMGYTPLINEELPVPLPGDNNVRTLNFEWEEFLRTASVTFVLQDSDGKEVDRVTLSVANNWSADLYFKEDGEYTLLEECPETREFKLVETIGTGKLNLKVAKPAEVEVRNRYEEVAPTQVVLRKFFGDTSALTAEDFPEGITVAVIDSEGKEYTRVVLSAENEWEYTLKDIPEGEYTVREINAEREGYHLSAWKNGPAVIVPPIPEVDFVPKRSTQVVTEVQSGNFTVRDGQTETVDIGNLYRPYKKVIIEKAFAEDSVLTAEDFPNGITIELHDINGQIGTVVVSAENNWRQEVLLPADAEIQMVECADGQPVGYWLLPTVTQVHSEQCPEHPINSFFADFYACQTEGCTPVITLTNKYEERAVNKVTIKKVFPEGSELTAEDFPDGITVEIYPAFAVPGREDVPVTTVVLSPDNNWQQIVELPEDTYVIEETDADREGYRRVTSITEAHIADCPHSPIEVLPGEEEVEEELKSKNSAMRWVDTAIPVDITFHPCSTEGCNPVVTVSNKYVSLTKQVTIKKVFPEGSALTAEDFPDGITMEIRQGEKVVATVVVSAENNWQQVVNLEKGCEFKLVETDADREGYARVTTVKATHSEGCGKIEDDGPILIGPGVEDRPEVSLRKTPEVVTPSYANVVVCDTEGCKPVVTVSNTYDKIGNTVTIEKVFAEGSDLTAEDFPDGITMEIRQGDKVVATVVVSAENNWKQELVLPEGDYNIVETNADREGYERITSIEEIHSSKRCNEFIEVPVTPIPGGGGLAKAIIIGLVDFRVCGVEDCTIDVTVSNSYRPLASNTVVIEKVFPEGSDLTAEDFPDGITMEIRQGDKVVATVVVSAENNWKQEVILPEGGYRVEETNADREGYKRITVIEEIHSKRCYDELIDVPVIPNPGGGGIAKGLVIGLVDFEVCGTDDCTIGVTVSNTYTKLPTNTVSIRKTFSENSALTAEDFPDGITVEIYQTSTDGGMAIFLDPKLVATVVLSAENDWTQRIDLERGCGFKFVETDAQREGYILTTTSSYQMSHEYAEVIRPGHSSGIITKSSEHTFWTCEAAMCGTSVYISNSYKPIPTTTTTIEKVFSAGSDLTAADFPNGIELEIVRDGRTVATVLVGPENNWKQSVELLEGVYSIVEKNVEREGYTLTTGFRIQQDHVLPEYEDYEEHIEIPLGPISPGFPDLKEEVETIRPLRKSMTGTKTPVTGSTFKICDGPECTAAITVSNSYERVVADVTVEIDFAAGSVLQAKGFPDGITAVLTDENGIEYTVVLNDANGWVYTFSGIAPGNYVMTQTGADAEGYVHTFTGGGAIAVTVDGDNRIKITNDYQKEAPKETEPDPTEPPTEPEETKPSRPVTPPNGTPKTGDTSNLLLWAMAALASLAGIIAIVDKKKRMTR